MQTIPEPPMDMRELKALEIAARNRLVCEDGIWFVPSQTTKAKYRVNIWASPSCECEAWQLDNTRPCKHILAARIVAERDGGRQTGIVVDAPPKKPNIKRNWSRYNLAQSVEKHRFQELLADLCAGIPEPKRAGVRGQKPHPQRDAVFAMVFKVYSTVSARRFTCDLHDAHDAGYIQSPMPGMKVTAFFENAEFFPILKSLIQHSAKPLAVVEERFAPDSSGFSTCRFDRWFDEKYGTPKTGRQYVKAHIVTGTKTNVITAVEIHDQHAADSPQFKPLVEATAQNFTIKEVCADKAYLSHENLELVERLGGTPFIPFKSNSVAGEPGTLWNRMFGYFQFRREEFLRHYHARSNVESTFAMVKAKFGDAVRSKTDAAMKNEVLAKLLAHNLCCLIMEQVELGIEPVFWGDVKPSNPDVLPMAR